MIAVACILIGGAAGIGGCGLARPHAAALPPEPVNCTPTAMLVNPCRPWFGAAANGNPGAGVSKIAQFDYVEKLVGRRLDIFRDYHSPPGTGPLGDLPLNATEIQLARRPGTYVDVNWKPATTWAQAGGGNAAVNSEIDRVAASIKSIAPHKVFLTLWWEPQHDVTGGTTCPVSPYATGGTPAQYIAMWRNVERRFAADGVSNVIWAMDYQAPANGQWDCLVPQLWPGNKLIDWVLYDTYSRNGRGTWPATVGRFYNVLARDSSPRVNFDAKPWGVGEFGTCSNNNVGVARDFYLQGAAAVVVNTYPRLKMYLAYDDTGGPQAGPGCLSGYDNNGSADAVKQANFNRFASAVLTRG
jgi:hypothetical protein